MDSSCLFCRIAAREIPADIVRESERVVAFRDMNPQAPTHILLIPKEHVTSVAALSDHHAGAARRHHAGGRAARPGRRHRRLGLAARHERRGRRRADGVPPALPSARGSRDGLASGLASATVMGEAAVKAAIADRAADPGGNGATAPRDDTRGERHHPGQDPRAGQPADGGPPRPAGRLPQADRVGVRLPHPRPRQRDHRDRARAGGRAGRAHLRGAARAARAGTRAHRFLGRADDRAGEGRRVGVRRGTRDAPVRGARRPAAHGPRQGRHAEDDRPEAVRRRDQGATPSRSRSDRPARARPTSPWPPPCARCRIGRSRG